MRKRSIIGAAVLGVALVSYSAATRKRWGPDLLGDPTYRSGRPSLCKPPDLSGDSMPVRTADMGRTPRLKGYEHAWEFRFATGTRKGGTISLCSEYGSIRVRGVDGSEARLVVTLSDPFPGGDRAIDDTRLNTSVRLDTNGVHIAVWQQTQGMTTFKSLMAKGARPVAVNMTLELPRAGVYALNLVANHQRVTVRDVDVSGRIEGYLSPGADLDIGLGGPLALRLNNANLKADWRRDAGMDFQGGTVATVRPLTSGMFEANFTTGDATLTFVGANLGLDVIALATPGPANVDIGPTEVTGVDTAGVHTRSAGFASAAQRVVVRVTSGGGVVVVRRGIDSADKR